jgi:CubicO group peptidase (beta-lactamase class C family)
VLQLCERGLIDLDAPAGGYLRAYRLVAARPGHRPPTVRQLLTHTAGLPQLVYPARAFQPVLGETVAYGQRVPALEEFYRGRLHLIAEPGARHTYSNHGFATLGQIVEDVTGQPLARVFRDRIFGPLGMTGTDLVRDLELGGSCHYRAITRRGQHAPAAPSSPSSWPSSAGWGAGLVAPVMRLLSASAMAWSASAVAHKTRTLDMQVVWPC